ncbi:MAG TPA: hypothetical protein VLB80_00490 [Candidatus Babeliales bacterium]|nr:hypothetical protein [Candidatus Babeliales bacterium]
MRFFNTAGPINPQDHYYVPHRLNEAELQQLIEQKKYFILHAPRQSGKTTAIQLFINELNTTEKYEALYINVEPAQIARNNVNSGMEIILGQLRSRAKIICNPHDPIFIIIEKALEKLSGTSFKDVMQAWSTELIKPIILFIDEIDSLVGDTLISVLRQLRAGYADRPDYFPQSICLIGVRDVRDYQIWSPEKDNFVLGGSAFNIKAESLTLPNFSLDQVRMLYLQHSDETGQQFTDEAIEYAYHLTQGQPWLVNALAYQACFKDVTDRTIPITKDVIELAKETLILRRDTHIDQLIDKLREPRVYNIIDTIISGTGEEADFPSDDLQYVRDLGLISQKGIAIANPIYQEVIPRALAYTKQEGINQQLSWYQHQDGSLNMHKLLQAFTQFYRENSDIWLEKFAYKESGPHILLMAFLQRIINGGGKLHREYALGRKRVDLLLEWKNQRIVIELKIKRGEKTAPEGLAQTAEYMDINNATEGHLVIFDRNPNASWDEKISITEKQYEKHIITMWTM